MHLEINKYSHYFTVKPLTSRGFSVTSSFSRRYVQWGFVKQGTKMIRAPIRNFFAIDSDKSTHRFHIGQYRRFTEYVEQSYIHKNEYSIVENKPEKAPEIELPIQSHWKLREEQVPAVDFMLKEDPDTNLIRKLLGIQTGKGKGLCSMWASSLLKNRIVIVVKPMYIEKWHKELLEIYDIGIEEVMVVQGGSEHLKALLELGMNDELDAKVILISNSLIRNWITAYEEYGDASLDLGYPCRPQDMFEVMGAGTRIIDELHQDFHFNFRLDLYTNIHASFSLSATLVSDDDFMNSIYQMVHHETDRFKGMEYDKYCATYSINYHLRNPNKIRFQDYSRKVYSHVMFEQSIMRHVPTLNNYFEMINKVIKAHFIRDYKPGYKLMVFCGSIDMCTKLTEYLSRTYPHLDVRRYVEQDPFENVIIPDIRVSTLLSAGTAIDIPDLFGVIMTTAVASSPSNLQSLGRLRKLKDGNTPWFAYLSCLEIDKHMEYDRRKRALLDGRAVSFKVEIVSEPV